MYEQIRSFPFLEQPPHHFSHPILMRTLCLHSFRTNAEIMKVQVKFAGYEDLLPALSFDYANGIHAIEGDDASSAVDPMLARMFPVKDYGDYREWWNSRREGDTIIYDRYDQCIETVVKELVESRYDGIMGFSQGGALVAAVLAMYVKGAIDFPPLKYAWIQGSFTPAHYSAQHYFRDLENCDREGPRLLVTAYDRDPIVPASKTRQLADSFPNSTYVEFDGRGHKLARLVRKRGSDETDDAATRKVLEFFSDLS